MVMKYRTQRCVSRTYLPNVTTLIYDKRPSITLKDIMFYRKIYN